MALDGGGLSLPKWAMTEEGVRKVAEELFIFDLKQTIFFQFVKYARNFCNSPELFLNDFFEYIKNNELLVKGTPVETVKNILLELIQENAKADYWFLAHDQDNGDILYLKNPGEKVKILMQREVTTYVKESYQKIRSLKIQSHIPLVSDTAKAFKLEETDIRDFFSVRKIEDLKNHDYLHGADLLVSQNLQVLDLSDAGYDVKVILPPGEGIFSVVFYNFLKVIKKIFTMMLKPAKLKFLAASFEKISPEIKMTPEQVKTLFSDFLNCFIHASEDQSGFIQEIGQKKYFVLMQILYKVFKKREGEKDFSDFFISVIVVYYYVTGLYETAKRLGALNEEMNLEKNAFFKNMMRAHKKAGRYEVLFFNDFMEFLTADKTTTLRNKYKNSKSRIQSLLPLAPPVDLEIPGAGGTLDQIPFCFTALKGSDTVYIHKWVFPYLLKDFMKRDRHRVISRITERWLEQPRLFKKEHKNFEIKRDDVSPFLLSLIEKMKQFCESYLKDELASLFFPNESQASLFSITPDDEYLYKNYVVDDSRKKTLADEYIYDLFLIRQNKVTLRPFSKIFALDAQEIIRGEEKLLIQVSFSARLLYNIKKIFRGLSGSKKNQKIKLSSGGRKRRKTRTTTSGSSAFETMLNQIMDKGGPESELVKTLLQDYYVEASFEITSKGAFKKLLNYKVISYDRPARIIYLSDEAVLVLKSGSSTSYKERRCQILKDVCERLESNIANEFVIVSEEEAASLDPRRVLLARLGCV